MCSTMCRRAMWKGVAADWLAFGYNRDGKKGKMQIVYGLLCAANGCPVAIEAFDGNTSDPNTLAAQIEKLKQRFGLQRIVLVGDRGMITDARIREELGACAGFDWISPPCARLRSRPWRRIRGRCKCRCSTTRDMAEIASPDYPGERLIVCRNRELAAERVRKRRKLSPRNGERTKPASRQPWAPKRDPLRGKDRIGIAVGEVIGQHKMAKHFDLTIEYVSSFSFRRNEAKIAVEAALDGLYVIRTNLPKEAIGAEDAVSAYKNLAQVERAFRSLKTADLDIRPIYHWLSDRVRAHVFLCMLAYYVEWHMRRKLAPMLFDDDDKEAALASRSSPVAKAPRSDNAKAKAAGKITEDGRPGAQLPYPDGRPRHAVPQRGRRRRQSQLRAHDDYPPNTHSAEGVGAAGSAHSPRHKIIVPSNRPLLQTITV